MADASTNPSAAPAKKGSKSTAAGDAGQIITVVGPEGGRRRAGRQFGPVGVKIDLSTITLDQLAAIKADPTLHIVAE